MSLDENWHLNVTYLEVELLHELLVLACGGKNAIEGKRPEVTRHVILVYKTFFVGIKKKKKKSGLFAVNFFSIATDFFGKLILLQAFGTTFSVREHADTGHKLKGCILGCSA